ncbi:Rv3654c family TadE-like protein [Nocardioides sp. AE5]|uniref:Rv3654c family TadE-like protein n=1 Tax=Nocardioides sp. AE5 TaxID=2962573 RepID=UPI00288195C1|nr:Rv3654c family TadE-like protein [Nocardioides sp. AE5]MDT0200558.1 pilus assembly protein TadG-related protein [Nocardioides sp. AE5]
MCRREPDSRPGPGPGEERGAATVLAVALVGVLVLLGMAGVFVTATGAAHRQAQAAADLAALAAAATLQQGGDPCEAATTIATANGAEVTDCVVAGSDVVVDVQVSGPEFLGHGFVPTARARAGPG